MIFNSAILSYATTTPGSFHSHDTREFFVIFLIIHLILLTLDVSSQIWKILRSSKFNSAQWGLRTHHMIINVTNTVACAARGFAGKSHAA